MRILALFSMMSVALACVGCVAAALGAAAATTVVQARANDVSSYTENRVVDVPSEVRDPLGAAESTAASLGYSVSGRDARSSSISFYREISTLKSVFTGSVEDVRLIVRVTEVGQLELNLLVVGSMGHGDESSARRLLDRYIEELRIGSAD